MSRPAGAPPASSSHTRPTGPRMPALTTAPRIGPASADFAAASSQAVRVGHVDRERQIARSAHRARRSHDTGVNPSRAEPREHRAADAARAARDDRDARLGCYFGHYSAGKRRSRTPMPAYPSPAPDIPSSAPTVSSQSSRRHPADRLSRTMGAVHQRQPGPELRQGQVVVERGLHRQQRGDRCLRFTDRQLVRGRAWRPRSGAPGRGSSARCPASPGWPGRSSSPRDRNTAWW